jgi:hypothetical protein|tara:strand:+ start:295 stop:882 length:588 start_codon:yes stop_codon:yes gene_type:complete
MTIVSSGAISINSLVGEYGGSAPHAMNEYYRGGSLVANHSNNGNVPTSGTIQLDDFYGANNTSPAPTVYSYSLTCGTDGGTGNGFRNSGGTSYGSLGSNPQSTAFAGGFNPTIVRWDSVTVKSNSDIRLTASGTLNNSGFTSITMPSGILTSSSNQTLNRTAAQYSTGGGETEWRWDGTSFNFNSSGTGTVNITE